MGCNGGFNVASSGGGGGTGIQFSGTFVDTDLVGGVLTIPHIYGGIRGLPCDVSYDDAGVFKSIEGPDQLFWSNNQVLMDVSSQEITAGTTWHYSFGGVSVTGMDQSVYDPDNIYADMFDPVNTKSPVNNQTGTTYTLQSTDHGKIIAFNNASAITLSVPDGLTTVAGNTDFCCGYAQRGVGVVTIAASGTATINSLGDRFNTAGNPSHVTIKQFATDDFDIQGALV